MQVAAHPRLCHPFGRARARYDLLRASRRPAHARTSLPHCDTMLLTPGPVTLSRRALQAARQNAVARRRESDEARRAGTCLARLPPPPAAAACRRLPPPPPAAAAAACRRRRLPPPPPPPPPRCAALHSRHTAPRRALATPALTSDCAYPQLTLRLPAPRCTAAAAHPHAAGRRRH